MPDLTAANARICLTSAAFLIHRHRILLVKHKKLGIWLVPGGHIEPNELPHRSAERECLEESGIRVKATSAQPILSGSNSQYLPLPFAINLHWISQENYQARLHSPAPDQPYQTKTWPNGCEQHLVFCYLVKPVGSVKFTQNIQETDGIGWFTRSQIDSFDTTPDIKQELEFVLSHNFKV